MRAAIAFLLGLGTAVTIAAVTSAASVPTTRAAPSPPGADTSFRRIPGTTENTTVGAAPAVAVTPNPAWTTAIGGAQWLWRTATVADPTVAEVDTFTMSFVTTGVVRRAAIDIAADNGYRVLVNGAVVVDSLSSTGQTYASPQQFPIPASVIASGRNRLTIVVRNEPNPGDPNPADNPAGLLYALSLNPPVAAAAVAVAQKLPPPGSGTGPHPNEPAGFAPLRVQPFDSVVNGDFYPSGVGNPTIVPDAESPGTSKRVAQMLFPAGFRSGVAPGSIWIKRPFSSDAIYVSFWVKLSSNWFGNDGAGANKVLYFDQLRGNAVVVGSIEIFGIGNAPLSPGIVVENIKGFVQAADLANGAPPTVNLPNNRGCQGAATRGVWHRYETLLVNNSPRQTDGTVKWWFDGQLCADYTNRIEFQTVGAHWNEVYWSPTYGGGGNPVPVTQAMYLKDLYVSGRN